MSTYNKYPLYFLLIVYAPTTIMSPEVGRLGTRRYNVYMLDKADCNMYHVLGVSCFAYTIRREYHDTRCRVGNERWLLQVSELAGESCMCNTFF